jgi:hypothetical protein
VSITSNSPPGGRRRSRLWAATAGASAVAVAVFVPTAALASAGSPRAAVQMRAIHAQPLQLKRVGTVNFAALSKKAASTSPATPGKPRTLPMGKPPLRNAGHATKASAHQVPAAPLTSLAGNVTGAKGFDGINSTTSLDLNGFDVTPPDEGMATGTSSQGTAIVQSLNLAVQAFSPSGQTLAGPVALNTFFDLPLSVFTSDPRVYWDPQTKHWFLTMLVVGAPFSPSGVDSAQYIAVSQTTDALGIYTIFSIPTQTSLIDNTQCPCFGDFDMVGADNSGFYITTNEFGIPGVGGGFNGTNLYAMSKAGLIAAANGVGPMTYFQYPIPTLSDPFGAYHLAPSSVTQGSSAPNDEYFTESDGNDFSNSALEVWALTNTNLLNSNTAPSLAQTNVATEGYSVPPNAVQKAGPIPFGKTQGATLPSPLETDFDAVQQTTYAGGYVYAQLDTGVSAGGGAVNSGAAWFALKPTAGSGSVSVKNAGNGYVQVNGHILYPSIGVTKVGHGYMAFSISGANNYPTNAYILFDDTNGAVGPVHIQKAGSFPLDDLSCYPALAGSGCRYGDYSASQEYNGRVYLATEYVNSETDVSGGAAANWATRIWSAPNPGLISRA